MDNSSHREELIEKYILGEMSGEELLSFEQEMEVNEDLRTETSFQKDIVSALQMERRAALKARMDNVNIPSPYASYYTAGIASAVLIGGIVLLTTLWPIEFNDDIPTIDEKTEIVEKQLEFDNNPIVEDLDEENEDAQLTETMPSESPEIVSEKPDDTIEENTSEISEEPKDKIENPIPNIVTPKAPEPGSGNGITTSNLESGSDEVLNNQKRETSKVEVEIKSSKTYDFHYQYFNSKLFLYGDFSKSPYELIELNTDKSKDLYMYFGGKYYALNSNQMEISKLTVLRDKIIIKGLDNLRLK